MPVQQIIPSVCPIFLSCVTKEFRPYRDMLAKDLSLPHVKVQVQEDFIEGGGSLLEKLDDYIKNCVAVIHLVGSGSGYKPKPIEVADWLKKHPDFIQRLPFLTDCLDRLSYTQWEVWLAIYHEVSCYVYKAEPSAIPASGFVEDPEERKLQEEHWQRLCEHGKDRSSFPNEHDLRILVLRSLSNILPRAEIKSHVVPKGLRSFDASDTAFFLDLLPGLHDENNLPESIRFWKHRIEAIDASTFTVGVIHGPSGCGKSSLVKAGLLPRLAQDVKCVYVEATADGTEAKLLKGLRRWTEIANDLSLAESLKAISEGGGFPNGSKILLVIDQFEQWLHGRQIDRSTELIQALGHCDGQHLQAIAIVRDDFWSDLCRFMNALETPLLQGQNSVFVDLFDQIHSENVLVAFGRGYGRLGDDVTLEQTAFVKKAVAELAENGRIISVRLALFAEMVKGKPWNPQTLKDIGGIEGVGFTFLEETFSTSKANPQYRRHQKAAQAVLKALLPESGTDIKGHMRSRQELLQDSRYMARLTDFDDLLHVLDNDLRLITPTSPESRDDAEIADNQAVVEKRYYQLTHDYLVPSLRDWLTRKRKETRKGRAELALDDQAIIWNARPENRRLPSLREWFQIQSHTERKYWTSPQTKMMKAAGQFHGLRMGAAGLLLALSAFTTVEIRRHFVEREQSIHAKGLVHSLVKADIGQVPTIIAEMSEYRRWTDSLLRNEHHAALESSSRKLHTSLALLPMDPSQVDYLYRRLLDANPHDFTVICEALTPYSADFSNKLWIIVSSPEKDPKRLRAAAALARYEPSSDKWDDVRAHVVEDMLSVPSVFLETWMKSLSSVRRKLLPSLIEVYRDNSRPEIERAFAMDILVDYATNQPGELANLVMDGNENQFKRIFPKLENSDGAEIAFLHREIDLEPFPVDLPSSDDKREVRANRQANASVALIRLDHTEKAWKLLAFHPKNFDLNSSDPRVRSYLIHRLAACRIDAAQIVNQINQESDVTSRRALVLSLGEFDEQRLTDRVLNELVPKLQDWYKADPDPGLHSAVEWLLKRWKRGEWLEQINGQWSENESWKESLEKGEQALADRNKKVTPYWYVNSQADTMIVIPGPVDFLMGSPEEEEGRYANEPQHLHHITRTYALSSTPVTMAQYRRFEKARFRESGTVVGTHQPSELLPHESNLPVTGVSWLMAAEYCNWLSEKEQLQPCYEISRDKEVALMGNDLSGYRFPTEAEIEYAARSGAMTSRYFGETDELLTKYAWYELNSQRRNHPVGLLKPNDLGFFDILGNVSVWCQDLYLKYPVLRDPKRDTVSTLLPGDRSLRGGAFNTHSQSVRSALRDHILPSKEARTIGFRVAKTLGGKKTSGVTASTSPDAMSPAFHR